MDMGTLAWCMIPIVNAMAKIDFGLPPRREAEPRENPSFTMTCTRCGLKYEFVNQVKYFECICGMKGIKLLEPKKDPYAQT